MYGYRQAGVSHHGSLSWSNFKNLLFIVLLLTEIVLVLFHENKVSEFRNRQVRINRNSGPDVSGVIKKHKHYIQFQLATNTNKTAVV